MKDSQDVLDETEENDEKYGKDGDESEDLWEFMDTVRTKAREDGEKRAKLAWKKARRANQA